MAKHSKTTKTSILDHRLISTLENLLFAWPLAFSTLLLWLCYRWDVRWLEPWCWAAITGGVLHLGLMLYNQDTDQEEHKNQSRKV